MSGPITSTEIEDILSSIRRLVSEEDRPPLRGAAAKGDKLVLTPALRIVPTAEPPLALTDPIAPGPPAANPHEPDSVSVEPVADMLLSADTAVPAEASPGLHFPSMPDDAPPATADLLPQPPVAPPTYQAAAALEAAISRQPGDWEPDEGDAARDAPWSAEWAVPELDEAPSQERDAPPAAEVPALAPADDTDFDRVWEDFLAEGTPEPSLPPRRAFTEGEADNLTWHEAPTDASVGEESTEIDEEMLRDIVRDVLREELQGPLGERITRNVRKLVRAEIYKAMTARDLG
jgi:hypothetical protein